jgi:ATP-dependent DNA ligase
LENKYTSKWIGDYSLEDLFTLLDCQDAILDCELCIWNEETKIETPFLNSKKWKENPKRMIGVFDILHLNGESLIEKSPNERLDRLGHVLMEKPNVLLHSFYIAKQHQFQKRKRDELGVLELE